VAFPFTVSSGLAVGTYKSDMPTKGEEPVELPRRLGFKNYKDGFP
jgi:hypothetical protein